MATALTLLLLTIPSSIDPEAELLCPAISIDPHNCRPIVGPIACSIGYYPGYKRELYGTQTVRSKTLQAWASHRTHITSNHLIVETIHLKLLRAQQGQTAPCSGILRWAEGACGVDDEWRTRVDCTEAGCRAPLLSNTETIKWRRVCRYLSSETIELWKVYRYLFSETIGLVQGLSIAILPNKRRGETFIDTYR